MVGVGAKWSATGTIAPCCRVGWGWPGTLDARWLWRLSASGGPLDFGCIHRKLERSSYDGGPSARSGHTAVWDDGSRMLWLHGGNDGFPKQDLWRYDSGQNVWSLISAEHAGPSGRWSHVAAWGSGNQVIYIHGGYLGSREGLSCCVDTKIPTQSQMTTFIVP